LITTIAAPRAGVLARITFHGKHKLRLRFDTPHGVDEIAGVLRAEFHAKLAAQFAAAEKSFVSGGTEVGELRFDVLWGEEVYVDAHFGNGDREILARKFVDGTFSDAEIGTGDGQESRVGGR